MDTKLKNIFTVRLIIGMLIGGTAGFAYYYFVGCTSGGCPITSNPYITIGYGILLGALLFYKEKKKVKENTEAESFSE
ncbi:MAG: hypothetical protein A2W91_14950 [Bacteroidetes bacterium GWF2_38_335]|nr:MAG: hypothetical protein A2W91_14950 [Bacteroidetes bacterium GWF2_38_335]OFY78496.1 MAG: hypothetical protein A2281_16260 [Bacteroidetes bacterium RIFOXYA12_FULL_38_20]HBS88444.1 hypothetical protein [Bacteroidales bacterium]